MYELPKKYVRGFVLTSGYYIEEYDSIVPKDPNVLPGHCRITLIAHTDLGGKIPSTIINMLAKDTPFKVLSKIKKIVEK